MLCSSATYQLGFREDLEEDDIEDGAGGDALNKLQHSDTEISQIPCTICKGRSMLAESNDSSVKIIPAERS